jgi:outer membrane immunogenic protein
MKKVRTHLLATAAIVTLGGSAFAADMGLPMKAPAPAPIPYVGWQGFYIGGNIGAARLNMTGNRTNDPGDFSGQISGCGGAAEWSSLSSCGTSATGVTAGVQVGYDWQSKYFVYGVVADWSWTNLKHSVSTGNCTTIKPHFEAKVDWLASFRGRMGLAVDDTLVYITGGLALGELKSSAGITHGSCVTSGCLGANYTAALSKVQAGWVAGAGVEHKLNQNWSVMGEFLYYDLGRASVTGSNDFATYTHEFSHEVIVGRVGLNYRF